MSPAGRFVSVKFQSEGVFYYFPLIPLGLHDTSLSIKMFIIVRKVCYFYSLTLCSSETFNAVDRDQRNCYFHMKRNLVIITCGLNDSEYEETENYIFKTKCLAFKNQHVGFQKPNQTNTYILKMKPNQTLWLQIWQEVLVWFSLVCFQLCPLGRRSQ